MNEKTEQTKQLTMYKDEMKNAVKQKAVVILPLSNFHYINGNVICYRVKKVECCTACYKGSDKGYHRRSGYRSFGEPKRGSIVEWCDYCVSQLWQRCFLRKNKHNSMLEFVKEYNISSNKYDFEHIIPELGYHIIFGDKSIMVVKS